MKAGLGIAFGKFCVYHDFSSNLDSYWRDTPYFTELAIVVETIRRWESVGYLHSRHFVLLENGTQIPANLII